MIASTMTTLVIVESPTKAKALRQYLGAGYTVRASLGHVRDLPAKELGRAESVRSGKHVRRPEAPFSPPSFH